MKYQVADEEFQGIANELYEKHKTDLGLEVPPSRVIFMRSDKKKKAYAYCRLIHGEYELLTDKRFFIVIINQNYDELTDEKKKYVILHELKHLVYDEETDKFKLLKHNLEEFCQLLINPNWNLDLVRNKKEVI